MPLSRRELLTRGSAAGLGIALAGSVDTIFGAGPASAAPRPYGGYGPLVADPAGILDLPQGFRYTILSREGDLLSTGGRVPGKHDGMATFDAGHGRTALVRNHEQGSSAVFSTVDAAPPSHVYDPKATGGTSTLLVGPSNELLADRVSLAGTATNCAGGRTPWGTWITCEETEAMAGSVYTKDHGWNFEVDPFDEGRNADPTPLVAMGRFPGEAVAIDPQTGTVYQTEDASRPFGLLYRFVPNEPLGGYGSLRAGGALSAMRVPGVDDLSTVTVAGTSFRGITWVPVRNPSAVGVTSSGARVQDRIREQFAPTGQVTRSQKLEGAWWGDDSLFFVVSYNRTRPGFPAHNGQIWKYIPAADTLSLELYFSAGQDKYDSPDNITVSPYGGGVILAEDGDGEQYLVGTTADKQPFDFARNALEDPNEFAGVTFSDDGKTLFANIQSPGITLAITGPWTRKNH